MSDCHQGGCCAPPTGNSARFRRALWLALVVNGAMFAIEFSAAWHASSVSLLADAVDFLGDSANYAIALFVLGLAPVWRSRSALIKGLSMGVYGIFVFGQAAWAAFDSTVPNAITMGRVGFLALAANVGVALLLYSFRDGDANMRSVWLCSRNDAIGNVAVLLAALGVFGTGSGWPDLVVATIMSGLAVFAAVSVVKQSLTELRGNAGQVSAKPEAAGHMH
ncbi:cation transporter [Peristeroidobacter soli]|jgi:Co/Zn/Cd efflux system component|uniref:cation transporter n=1 Tax=Peristeroidobacter soli TaxID=2497877 RepID=UPI00101CAF5B|nr:cation transporter [Peristeroidobacter soli]